MCARGGWSSPPVGAGADPDVTEAPAEFLGKPRHNAETEDEDKERPEYHDTDNFRRYGFIVHGFPSSCIGPVPGKMPDIRIDTACIPLSVRRADSLMDNGARRGFGATFLRVADRRQRVSAHLQCPQCVEDRRRFQAVGVVRIDKGEADHPPLVDDKRTGERQLPGFIAVVFGETDA